MGAAIPVVHELTRLVLSKKLAELVFDQPRSQDEARALLHALRHVTEKETDAIAALDRRLLRRASYAAPTWASIRHPWPTCGPVESNSPNPSASP